MRYLGAFALTSSLLAGCQAAVTPVPVQGTIEQLVGEWSGQYASTETGRRGSILFHLEPGRDTATGDVLMTPDRGYNVPSAAERSPDEPWWKSSTQLLQISFVRCDRDEVSGFMKPYVDPETGELTHTDFVGYIVGDTLKGTYVAYVERIGRRTGGSWTVVRVRR
jgi:hypothetical protein